MFIWTHKNLVINVDSVSVLQVLQKCRQCGNGLKESECEGKPWVITASFEGDKNDCMQIAEYNTEEAANKALRFIFDNITLGYNVNLCKIGE